MTIITIPFKQIDLSKCTSQGLDLLMECLLFQEDYEYCAFVRDELMIRKLIK